MEFRSAQSTHAVCGYCQSTVVRQGETLSRIGKMAELFDDHSPLQLMASGTWKPGAFTLIGRLQYKYGEGTWTEWHALFNDGSQRLSERRQRRLCVQPPAGVQRAMPDAATFRVGAHHDAERQVLSRGVQHRGVRAVGAGGVAAFAGLGTPFAMVELRSAEGEVLSIDYGPR